MNDETTQKRWRMLIILALLFSLAALIAIAVFNPSPWGSVHPGSLTWERSSPGLLSRLETPPRWLAMGGVLLATSLSGILVLYLLPAQVSRMAQSFSGQFVKLARLALLGLIGSVLVSVVSLSATVAMGTFPLAVFLGSLLFVACFYGIVALAYTLGKNLLRRAAWDQGSPVLALLLGMLLLFTLIELPVLGILFRMMLIFLGFGVAIATRFGTGRPWDLDPLYEGKKNL